MVVYQKRMLVALKNIGYHGTNVLLLLQRRKHRTVNPPVHLGRHRCKNHCYLPFSSLSFGHKLYINYFACIYPKDPERNIDLKSNEKYVPSVSRRHLVSMNTNNCPSYLAPSFVHRIENTHLKICCGICLFLFLGALASLIYSNIRLGVCKSVKTVIPLP